MSEAPPRNFIQIAVLHYFESFDRKTYVMEYFFSKAAQAYLLKMYSISDARLLIWGIRETVLFLLLF